jgi:uncharacterized protein
MAAQEGQTTSSVIPTEFDHYFVSFLLRGPVYSTMPDDELEVIHEAHVAYRLGLYANGVIRAAGPVSTVPQSFGGEDVRGMSILNVATLEEARTLIEADPAVKAGRFLYEIMRWTIPKGQLS